MKKKNFLQDDDLLMAFNHDSYFNLIKSTEILMKPSTKLAEIHYKNGKYTETWYDVPDKTVYCDEKTQSAFIVSKLEKVEKELKDLFNKEDK